MNPSLHRSSTVDPAPSPHVEPQGRGHPRNRPGTLADARVRREPETGCVVWLGPVDKDGYPVTRMEGRTLRPAREVSAMHYGQQQHLGWVHVWNLCGERRCIAPMHHAPAPLRRVMRSTRTHQRAVAAVRKDIVGRAMPGGRGGYAWAPGHPLWCSRSAVRSVAEDHGLDGLVPCAVYGHLALLHRPRGPAC